MIGGVPIVRAMAGQPPTMPVGSGVRKWCSSPSEVPTGKPLAASLAPASSSARPDQISRGSKRKGASSTPGPGPPRDQDRVTRTSSDVALRELDEVTASILRHHPRSALRASARERQHHSDDKPCLRILHLPRTLPGTPAVLPRSSPSPGRSARPTRRSRPPPRRPPSATGWSRSSRESC